MTTGSKTTKVTAHQDRDAASYVVGLFNTSRVPDFLTNVVMTALFDAARAKGVDIWKGEDFNVTAVAELFALTQMFAGPTATVADPIIETDPAWTRLANAISELATNPTTPVALYNSVIDFLNSEGSDLWGKLIVTPPMIQKILIEASVNQEVSHAKN